MSDATQGLKGAVKRFDASMDERAIKTRGNPIADRIFYTASELGDFGLLWVIFGVLRALRGGALNERAALRAVAATGVESAIVNVVLKSIFGRGRPAVKVDHPLPLRQPLSSSFPSGHATAAFCAAVLLSEDDPLAPVYFGAATVVAASRVYVRIHHASDVLGGIAVGLGLGLIGRRIAPLDKSRTTYKRRVRHL